MEKYCYNSPDIRWYHVCAEQGFVGSNGQLPEYEEDDIIEIG